MAWWKLIYKACIVIVDNFEIIIYGKLSIAQYFLLIETSPYISNNL